MIALTSQNFYAFLFLGLVIALCVFQLFSAMRWGKIFVPGKRHIHRVKRKVFWSFYGAMVFYVLAIGACLMAGWGVLKQELWPGPKNPTQLSAVGLGGGKIQLSWLSPEGYIQPERYFLFRATETGRQANDYKKVAIANDQPYDDAELAIGTRYFYRVGAVYASGEVVLSNEDSAVAGP